MRVTVLRGFVYAPPGQARRYLAAGAQVEVQDTLLPSLAGGGYVEAASQPAAAPANLSAQPGQPGKLRGRK